jgi:hypothetical protein
MSRCEAWELFRFGPLGSDAAKRRPYPGGAGAARLPLRPDAHSTGGPFAFTAALHAPDKIKAVAAIEPAGAKVEWIDLPTRGMKGNSHMVMMDKNSDQVAAIVDGWPAKTLGLNAPPSK